MSRSGRQTTIKERDVAHNPFFRYVQSGNTRPSQERLERTIPQLDRSTKHGTRLVLADMCIDLAFYHGTAAGKHLDKAAETLSDIVDDAAFSIGEGYREGERLRHLAVQAQLRLGELPLWESVVSGRQPQPSYFDTLLTARAAFSFVQGGKGLSTMVEFMPILIGARLNAISAGQGWIGRLALAREEQKEMMPAHKNPNWDTGIMVTDRPEEFVHPRLRLQVKTANGDQSERSRNAGVVPVIAKGVGFGLPGRIIEGCLAEVGEAPCLESRDTNPFSSRELDQLTFRLHSLLQTEVRL